MKPRFIHIGSWNIEHFGRDDDNPSNQFAIAEHIEMSGVNVLALQEMYVTNTPASATARLENRFLQAALDLIEEHTGQHWEYELFRNKNPGDLSQLCGIAWNTARASKVGETFRIAVPTSATDGPDTLSLWDRHPHAVKFKAVPGEDAATELTDFVLVPLHMKSNVGQRHIVMRTRFHEVKGLVGPARCDQGPFRRERHHFSRRHQLQEP